SLLHVSTEPGGKRLERPADPLPVAQCHESSVSRRRLRGLPFRQASSGAGANPARSSFAIRGGDPSSVRKTIPSIGSSPARELLPRSLSAASSRSSTPL